MNAAPNAIVLSVMEVERQTPLLTAQESGKVAAEFCGDHGDDSPAKLVPIRLSCCSVGCVQNHPSTFPKTVHQTSVDSGYENSLDPISEHLEYCTNSDISSVADDYVEFEHGRKLASAGPEQAVDSGFKNKGTRRGCANSSSPLHHCCGGNVHSHLQEETELAPLICQRNLRSTALIGGKSSSYPVFPGNSRGATQRCERYRTKSGSSSYSDDVFASHGRSDHIMTYGRDDIVQMKEYHPEVEKSLNKVNRLCLLKLLVLALGIILGFASAITYLVYITKIMEGKIATLEEAAGQMSNGPPSLSRITSVRSDDVRPLMHLVLKSQTQIPANSWNGKILQWKPEITENGGLEYDDEAKCLIVRDPGTYFVYNQIYVFRHVPPSGQGIKGLSNHTMFHAIYKRPFNFPLRTKPPTVTESALSSCWNANADTQIHSSYQGIIVKLQKNEQVFVALEDYNESMDTLDPRSTFFGAFKL